METIAIIDATVVDAGKNSLCDVSWSTLSTLGKVKNDELNVPTLSMEPSFTDSISSLQFLPQGDGPLPFIHIHTK